MEGGDQNILSTRVMHFRSQHRGVTEKDTGHHTLKRDGDRRKRTSCGAAKGLGELREDAKREVKQKE